MELANHHPLLTAFQFEGVRLDVYGESDGEVFALTEPGRKFDILPLVRDEVIDAAQRAVDRQASQRRLSANEQIEFDRALAELMRRAA